MRKGQQRSVEHKEVIHAYRNDTINRDIKEYIYCRYSGQLLGCVAYRLILYHLPLFIIARPVINVTLSILTLINESMEKHIVSLYLDFLSIFEHVIS